MASYPTVYILFILNLQSTHMYTCIAMVPLKVLKIYVYVYTSFEEVCITDLMCYSQKCGQCQSLKTPFGYLKMKPHNSRLNPQNIGM